MIAFAVLVCLLISAMFSGIEAGILSINRVRLRHQVKLREEAAIKLNRLLAHPERLLVTVLVVTNFMNVCAVALSTRELVRWLGAAGYLAAFVVWLPIYLGVELLPKSVFRRFPYRALAPFAGILRIAGWLLSPLLGVGSAIYNLLLSNREHGMKKIFIAREDFKYLTIESERTGALTKPVREMIHNVIDYRAVTVRDVMTSLAGVRTIPSGATFDELFALSRSAHLDWLPVVSGAARITGIVNVFDVLIDRKKCANAGDCARRIVTVGPDEPAYNVIRKLRAARNRLAAVLDANGTALGLVNLDDLIKRLVSPAGGMER